MILYSHRINTVKEMRGLPVGLGAEIDVRDFRDILVAAHDPFTGGDLFKDVIGMAGHRPLIINVKCEGVEDEVMRLMEEFKIEDYFLLDCTFPAIVKLGNRSFTKIAIRFSEYEGMDTLRSMRGKVEWVWADCFTKLPYNTETYKEIKYLGYKICLVSPDLLGQPEQIDPMTTLLKRHNIIPDAVCVKLANMSYWEKVQKSG